MNEAPKLCVACKHFTIARMCINPANMETSLIDGRAEPRNSAGFMRLNDCGKEGRFWEPRQ